MFALKKALGALLMPLPVAMLILVCGGIAWYLGRRRLARSLLIGAVLLLFICSIGPVGNALLGPLEYCYPATLDASALIPAPRYVVVLGAGFSPRKGLPVTAALEPEAVVRIAEGLRLLRQLNGARLIVSGGSVDGHPPSAYGYALAATQLGVPSSAVVVVDGGRDTGAEIRAIHSIVGGAPVLLVTSAAHMRRAMAYSARVGLRAIPAPTGNRTRPEEPWSLRAFFLPSASSLRKTEVALHEYLGLLALRLNLA
ncbi:MAG TPA: ElyC/SanA/YdcF family protein [Steroidobacteraceae bacterium]|jgi:uncharacterized SAM-binding protein YcdF (DUF218 family)